MSRGTRPGRDNHMAKGGRVASETRKKRADVRGRSGPRHRSAIASIRKRPFIGCLLTLRLHPRCCSRRLWTLSRGLFWRCLRQRLQRYIH
jgi:hypothetical protein